MSNRPVPIVQWPQFAAATIAGRLALLLFSVGADGVGMRAAIVADWLWKGIRA
jgi:hypothetical protein